MSILAPSVGVPIDSAGTTGAHGGTPLQSWEFLPFFVALFNGQQSVDASGRLVMKKNYLKIFIGYSAITLILLFSSFTATAQHVRVFDGTTWIIPPQTVSLQKADGSVSTAKFIAEIILLSDGRANGGWGVWEQNLSRPILHRVVSGKKRGSLSSFNAIQLSQQPASEITSTFQETSSVTPTGTVTFFIDGIPTSDGAHASLTANGRLEKLSGTINIINASFTLTFVGAPPQTVEIATLTDFVTGTFSTSALIFPTVGAMGFLRITTATSDEPHYYGTGVYKSIDGGRSWMIALSAQNPLTPDDLDMIMIRPHPDPSEPCRIYDIAGTQVTDARHFEAETDVTSFKLQEL